MAKLPGAVYVFALHSEPPAVGREPHHGGKRRTTGSAKPGPPFSDTAPQAQGDVGGGVGVFVAILGHTGDR